MAHPPMKIAHVIDYFHTDFGYQEYYLAKYMADAGHAVRVISSGFRQSTVAIPGPDGPAGAAALEAAGVEVVRLPARQLGHDRVWLRGLESALGQFRPDAVHCHTAFAPTAVRVSMAKLRLGYTLLVDNHAHEDVAPASKTLVGRAAYVAYRVVAGSMLRARVDTWVGIGPYEARFLRRRLRLRPDAVELIPLGFDPEIFRFDGQRRERLRRERGWSRDLVVAVTGKIYARKRPDLAARACAQADARRRVRLVFAGRVDADALAAVRREAATLLTDGRLEVLPMLDRRDLADLYLAADVVIFPRLPSISIYEAAGTGVRLLVGRDEFSEWLQSQCPSVEAVDLADLGALLSPADDRAGRAAAAHAIFSWPVISERFLEHYGAPPSQ
jgi:glycosyltransferase involved in cell wall biosynthesis